MKSEQIINILERNGLAPATKRPLCLFTMSCIAHGYVQLTEKVFGQKIMGIGAIGDSETVHTFQNEKQMGDEIGKQISRKEELVEKARSIFKQFLDEYRKQGRSPKGMLLFLCENFPKYMLSIGLYNRFWRYLGNDWAKEDEAFVEKLRKDREKIAKVYVEIDKRVRGYADRLGNPGIAQLTIDEMKEYCLNSRLPADLSARAEGYLYLDIDQEFVVTDRKVIADIKNHFFSRLEKEVSELKGVAAFPGKAKGVVYFPSSKKPPKEYILVCHQTSPDETMLIQGAKGIVTDEGGILCHAAGAAREFGIPCIIGTRIATRAFKDGDLVELEADSKSGVIRKL